MPVRRLDRVRAHCFGVNGLEFKEQTHTMTAEPAGSGPTLANLELTIAKGCALEIPGGDTVAIQKECLRLIPSVARTDYFGCPTRRSEEATDGNLREAL